MRDMKMRDMKMRDMKMRDMKMRERKMRDRHEQSWLIATADDHQATRIGLYT